MSSDNESIMTDLVLRQHQSLYTSTQRKTSSINTSVPASYELRRESWAMVLSVGWKFHASSTVIPSCLATSHTLVENRCEKGAQSKYWVIRMFITLLTMAYSDEPQYVHAIETYRPPSRPLQPLEKPEKTKINQLTCAPKTMDAHLLYQGPGQLSTYAVWGLLLWWWESVVVLMTVHTWLLRLLWSSSVSERGLQVYRYMLIYGSINCADNCSRSPT